MREMIAASPAMPPMSWRWAARGVGGITGRRQCGSGRGLAYDGTAPGGLLGAGFGRRRGLPVINIAGCPIHPGWFVDTLLQIAAGTLTPGDLMNGSGRWPILLAGPSWMRPQ
jgi:hypothetical protein